jgi:hypothetical protein
LRINQDHIWGPGPLATNAEQGPGRREALGHLTPESNTRHIGAFLGRMDVAMGLRSVNLRALCGRRP